MQPDWTAWKRLVNEVSRQKPVVKVALVGKYVELHDAYISVREALKHAALQLGVELDLRWVHSAELEKGRGWDVVHQVDGIVVPGGFGSRGIEGKIQVAEYARKEKIPYLGLCLGMQLMVIEFARQVLNLEEANSTEFDRTTLAPVIDLMPEQQQITDLGGTMRLGLYPCSLQPGTLAAAAYGVPVVEERHRHRFEFNNTYRAQFEANGMSFSGLSPNGKLVEIAEIPDHPFMVGTQFHPEFLSRPNRPHPLFLAFLKAVCERSAIQTQTESEPS
jgi:CTP synthase